MRRANIERDSMGRLAVTYWRIDRRDAGRLRPGTVWTLFDRRKPLHWLTAVYVLVRDGYGVRRYARQR